jgi:hypothetical protein
MNCYKLTRDNAAIMEVQECHVYAESEAQAKQVAKERLTDLWSNDNAEVTILHESPNQLTPKLSYESYKTQ